MFWSYVYIVIPDNGTTFSFSAKEEGEIFKLRKNDFF